MLVVTTNEIHGWELQRVCGEVYGVHLHGANDPSNPADSRAAAVARMLEHTRAKGGNAVIGLRLSSVSFGDRAEVCAYGTAVVAAPVDEAARQTATALGYGQPAAADEQPAAAEPEPQQPTPEPEQQPASSPYQPGSPYQPSAPYQPTPPYGQPGYPQQQPYPQGYPQQPNPQGYPPQQYPQQYPPGYPQQQ